MTPTRNGRRKIPPSGSARIRGWPGRAGFQHAFRSKQPSALNRVAGIVESHRQEQNNAPNHLRRWGTFSIQHFVFLTRRNVHKKD